jgi:hypothetical protein
MQIAEERRREIEAQFEAADPSKPNGAVELESVARPTIKRAPSCQRVAFRI